MRVRARESGSVFDYEREREKEGEIAYCMMEIISHCSVEIVCNADLGYVEYPEFPCCCS